MLGACGLGEQLGCFHGEHPTTVLLSGLHFLLCPFLFLKVTFMTFSFHKWYIHFFVFSRIFGTKLKSLLKSSPSPFPSPSSRSSQLPEWFERELAILPGKIVQNGVSSVSQQGTHVYLAGWHPLSTDGQSFFRFPWLGTWGLSYSFSPASPCSSRWPEQGLFSRCPLYGHLGCFQGFATMKHTAPCTRSRASLREAPTFRIWHCPVGMMLPEPGLLTWEMRRVRCVCSVC